MDVNNFLEIEKKYDLNFLELEEINYWQYARFEIWNHLISGEKLSLQESHRRKDSLPVWELFCNLVKSYCSYLFSKKRSVDICFVNHSRRILENGFYECMYTESLVQKYPNSVVLEKPYNYGHLTPVKTQNVYYMDWIIIIGNIYEKAHAKLKTKQYKDIWGKMELQLREAYTEIQEAYDIEVSLNRVVRKCAEKYFACKIQYKMYEKLLKKFSPKLIVEVCHYNRQCMLINEIAKKIGIPTVEIQHGLINPADVPYNYKVDKKIPQLPDSILLFSEYWKSQMYLPIDSEKLIPVGFPYFEKKIKEFQSITKKNEKRTILFISQGPIGDKLSQFAVDLSEKLDMSQNRIIYKLHPGEYEGWENVYKSLAESEVEVVAASDRNIYSFFAESDVQIGVYSTAIYEGIGFGLDTYIYNVTYADMMQNLIDSEYAKLVDSVDELISEMQKDKETIDGSSFWKRDAIENQCAEINKYL